MTVADRPDTGQPVAATIGPACGADRAALLTLLAEAGLTDAGFETALEDGDVLVSRDPSGRLTGCAALERYGPAVLLRSVAVEASLRGTGTGRALVAAALERARAGGGRDAYLLTMTAAGFFTHLGWERCDRAAVPPAVAASVEFTAACPASAIALRCSI